MGNTRPPPLPTPQSGPCRQAQTAAVAWDWGIGARAWGSVYWSCLAVPSSPLLGIDPRATPVEFPSGIKLLYLNLNPTGSHPGPRPLESLTQCLTSHTHISTQCLCGAEDKDMPLPHVGAGEFRQGLSLQNDFQFVCHIRVPLPPALPGTSELSMLFMERRRIALRSSLLPQESSELITSFVQRQVCVALCQVPPCQCQEGRAPGSGAEARLGLPVSWGEGLL